MAKRVLRRNESNKSSKSGSGPSEVSSLPYAPVTDVTQIISQSQAAKHYDSESAIWRDAASENGSVSISNRAGISGGGITNQSLSHSAFSSKRNSDISVTNLTEESIDSLQHRDQLGGIEEYALETQFEYATEELIPPNNQSERAARDINQVITFAPEASGFSASNQSGRQLNEIRTDRRESTKSRNTEGTETQFESNEFLLQNDIEFDKGASIHSDRPDSIGKHLKPNEIRAQNELHFDEKDGSPSRNQNGRENHFASNEVLLKHDIEFETYREAVKRRDKKSSTKVEYSFRNDALGRSDSTKRLISESSASSSARNSSVISDTSLDFENVLYTESEHSSKHRSIATDTLERKDKAQTLKSTATTSADVQTQHDDGKPKEVAKRYVKNKRLKTNEEKPSTSAKEQPSRTGTLSAQDIAELQKALYTGGFKDHTRIFKPKPKILISEKASSKRATKKFSAINAEVPPPKRHSLYEYNIRSNFSSGYPITLSKSQADLLTSQRVFLTKSKSMTSLNGTGASRYSLRGFSALPNDIKVVAVPQELQRPTLRKARSAIEMAISNFHIKFDSEATHYHPGTPITGKVVMDVWNTVEIRYVEFVLQGRATVRIFGKNGKFIDRPHNEVYLQKRIILLSPPDGDLSMTLAPGKYVSEFAYKLPEELPATVGQADVSDACVFSVTYSARANVCDFLHAKHVPQSERYAQVVKSCKKEFHILPAHDLRSVPGAMEPIVHAEQFNVMCTPLSTANTSVLVKLDHQLFAIGDTMNLSLEVCTPDPKRIKGITANMVQTVIFQPPVNRKYSRTVIKAIDVQRYQKPQSGKGSLNGHSKNTYRCSFGIPIPANLIPSVLLYAHIIQVNYRMDIKVTFKSLGGALNMSIPVILTSASEPDKANAPVPLFNKPIMQFPYFSRGPLRDSGKSQQSTHSTGSRDGHVIAALANGVAGQKHERVRADYVSCFSFKNSC